MSAEEFERPSTEAEWERHMQVSDARAARYGELLETLIDHPDRDEIIAREMGWDRESEGDAEEGFELDVDAINRAAEDALNDPEVEEQMQRDEDALHAIEAYTRGYEWGLSVHRALQPFLQAPQDDDDEDAYDPDDPLIVAFGESLVVAVKIAGGHGIGYDEDTLCGNIVNCKKSLAAAERSLAALEELARCNSIPRVQLQPLIEEGRDVRKLVEDRIAELRSQVWWE